MERDEILAQVRMITLIEDINVTDAEIVDLINQGMQEISVASTWSWLETSETLSLVADQQAYALPTSFDFMVAIADDDNDRTIPYVAPSTFFEDVGNDTGNTSTQVDFYTIWEDMLYFTPIPSTSDTDRFTCYYYQQVSELASGPASPAFHVGFHQILVEYVKWKLWDREEYFDQSERSFIKYTQYLVTMHEWYERRAKRQPYIAGDGRFYRGEGDPNIPFLRTI